MAIAFIGWLVGGIIFTGYHLYADIQSARVETATWIPIIFLGLALFIALGFEFVNGFHDTANAVATVIYTHSLPPVAAVIWSGCCSALTSCSARSLTASATVVSGMTVMTSAP
jgi:PiT family inorganic phosphate transporter